MTWFVWTIIAYLLNAISVLVDKALFHTKQVRRPEAYVIIITTLSLSAFLLAPFGLKVPSPEGFGLSLLTGFCFSLALWLMFSALQKGEASRVTPFIGTWSPIFVLLTSYILIGERLSLLEFISFALLISGGFLIVEGRGGLTKQIKILAIGAALAFALFYTLSKQVFIDMGFISGLIWIRVGAFLFALLLLLFPSTWPDLKRTSGVKTGAKFAFALGQIAAALSGLVINYAISLGNVTLINALQGLQYIFLFILVVIFSHNWPKLLKEEFSRQILFRKLLATLLIVTGLAAIAFI